MGNDRIEGPSIRFAEEAMRAMRNMHSASYTTFEDDRTRKIIQTVTDLEANLTFEQEITIAKSTERSKAEGREVIGKRKNTWNKDVYIVVATEDEMVGKGNSFVSKALRNNALRAIPSDIVEEAMDACRATMASEDKRDPAAATKRLVDAFVSIGVKPEALKSYLGHDIDSCSPAEMAELRGVFASIKEGGSNWKDVLEAKTGTTEDKKPTEAGTVAERVRAKAQASRTVVEAPLQAQDEPGSNG